MRRALTVALLLPALALTAAACDGHTYDEAAHRTAVEAALPNVDWPAYRAAVEEICDHDPGTFEFDIALAVDEGRLERLEDDVTHMCPDRLEEIDEVGGG